MTKVKICGITNLEDARAAADAKVDFLGFVFYPKSPRHVTPEQVREIVDQLDHQSLTTSRLQFVGVFVDQEPEIVAQTLYHCRLDYAQLHGKEPPETVARLMKQGFGVIKAFRVGSSIDLANVERYRATAYVLDAYVPGQPGGTGHGFDWALAVQAKKHGPILLAGGLTPENVSQAIRAVKPWGVDVSSGVEATPGRKDHDKLRRFAYAAKNL